MMSAKKQIGCSRSKQRRKPGDIIKAFEHYLKSNKSSIHSWLIIFYAMQESVGIHEHDFDGVEDMIIKLLLLRYGTNDKLQKTFNRQYKSLLTAFTQALLKHRYQPVVIISISWNELVQFPAMRELCIYMSHFAYACKTEGQNGISHLISTLCVNCLISIPEYSRLNHLDEYLV